MCEKLGFTEGVKANLPIGEDPAAAFEISGAAGGRWEAGRGNGRNGSLPLPRRCMLTHLQLFALSGASTPTTVTWWLSNDSTGREPLSDQKSTLWVPGGDGLGGVAAVIGYPWVATPESESLFVHALGNEGSVVARVRVFWYTMSDLDLTPEHLARLEAMKAGGC